MLDCNDELFMSKGRNQWYKIRTEFRKYHFQGLLPIVSCNNKLHNSVVKSINAIHAPYCVFPCFTSFEYVFLQTCCFLMDDEKCVNCHGLASIDAYRIKNRINYDLFGTGKYSVTSFLVKGAGSKIYKISYLILVNVINTDWIIDEIVSWANIKDINSWIIV